MPCFFILLLQNILSLTKHLLYVGEKRKSKERHPHNCYRQHHTRHHYDRLPILLFHHGDRR